MTHSSNEFVIDPETGLPLVAPVREAEGRVTIRCPYCDKRHRHSAADGHRHAHCSTPRPPGAADGYVIVGSSDQASAPEAFAMWLLLTGGGSKNGRTSDPEIPGESVRSRND